MSLLLLFNNNVSNSKIVKAWNGVTWVSVTDTKVWNGSIWVTQPVKLWNGSTWET